MLKPVNLISDTQTLPTDPMRAAIAAAEVGDEQAGTDPTVERLNRRVAELAGMEDAVFVPSGTMANLVAAATWTDRGDAVIAGGSSHSVEAEAGSFAAVAGVLPVLVPGDGRFTADALGEHLEPGNRFRPNPTLVVLEQTVNYGGGLVWDRSDWYGVAREARDADLAVHVDGARVFNATVATGTTLDAWTRPVDSIYIDFTKGLGAPFGAVLAGPAAFIDEAARWKHRLGGAMRQAGMMAAACIHALDHHVDRLDEDHERARSLSRCLAELGCEVQQPETNMVWFTPPTNGPSLADTQRRLGDHGVDVGVLRGRIRLVTHLDIDDDAIDRARRALRRVLG